jgi:hypothetical protein
LARLARLLPLWPCALGAQVTTVEGPLPPEVEAQAFELLNSPTTVRLTGGARVPEGGRIEGDVAVLGGSLDLAGEVTGSVWVVNADLTLYATTRVGGPVVVLGGVIAGADEATLEGGATAYTGPLRYRVAAGRLEPLTTDQLSSDELSADLGFGQARLAIRASGAYNRVEGLPVRLGAIVRTSGSNPLNLEAHTIWRSVSGLSLEPDRLGHYFALTQALGGRGTAAIGVAVHDEIAPIEDQGFSGPESSLATFLLREDLRDHFRRDGWTAFGTFRPGRPPFEARVAFREEMHQTAPLRSPWTLRDDDVAWRPLPLVAEGRAQSLETILTWDSRNDPLLPADGWLVEATFEKQIGGLLRLPDSGPAVGEPADPPSPPLEPAADLPRFTRGALDVRRYSRVGPTARLTLRAFAAGSLDESPLPPQHQIALGGEGSLPGHRRFSLDCGARSTRRLARTGEGSDGRVPEVVFPAYGCDRVVLFQAELQGALPSLGNPLPDEWETAELASVFNLQPVWSLFLDAGQGWEQGDLGNGVPRIHSPTRADVGVGIAVGPLGVYWAYPLNGERRRLNFFVRLTGRL